MPPSKRVGHPLYDDRLVQVVQLVSNEIEKVRWSPILYRTRDIDSHHTQSRRRDPDEIYRDLSINESFASLFKEDTPLIVVDDVITSGAHFSAAKQRLQERFRNTEVAGMFWAKAETAKDFE